MRQQNVAFLRYERKRVFTSFQTGFTAFAVFFTIWMVFCVDRRYRCQNKAKNMYIPALKMFNCIRLSFFSTLKVFFHRSEVPLPTYGHKRMFTAFETGFTAFAVLFLALWRLFCVNRRYRCQDTGENGYSPDLKPVLRHWPFYF